MVYIWAAVHLEESHVRNKLEAPFQAGRDAKHDLLKNGRSVGDHELVAIESVVQAYSHVQHRPQQVDGHVYAHLKMNGGM